MTRKLALSFASLVLVAAAAGSAHAVSCSSTISGEGRISTAEGSADWNKYDGRPPDELAGDRAIWAWTLKVRADCPYHSLQWAKARGKDVDCEGSAGHVNCTATAAPARYAIDKPDTPSHGDGPSFDCRTATVAAEKAVCRSERLSCADRGMAMAYDRLIDELRGSKREEATQEQREFIQYRNACGSNGHCIGQQYKGQTKDIDIQLVRLGIRLEYEACAAL